MDKSLIKAAIAEIKADKKAQEFEQVKAVVRDAMERKKVAKVEKAAKASDKDKEKAKKKAEKEHAEFSAALEKALE